MNCFWRGTLPTLNYGACKPFFLPSKIAFSRHISSSMAQQSFTEAWITGANNTQFYTRTYTPTDVPLKAAIVFVHGFAEHIGRYTHFHPLLAARGVGVFSFDQRGFGLTAQDTTGKKSKKSSYGKTTWKEQMTDIDWAIGHAKKTFENTPIFLMGHSMGGGEVLGFGTAGNNDHQKHTLAGIIATSPLILQASPAPKVAKWIGGKLSAILPTTLIPAPVKEEDLSHDPEVNAAYLKDPLVKLQGSLKNLSDMLSKGEELLRSSYSKWAKNIPVLIIHGTEDKVTSHKASQAFYDKLPTDIEKELSLFEGGYHELQNEPNGVQERLVNEIVAFIEKYVTQVGVENIQTEQQGTAAQPGLAETGADALKAKM